MTVGPVCGLLLTACWAPMAPILFRFPDLDDPGDVVRYWAEWGATTQLIIASVVVGYPFLLVFLADLSGRWTVRTRSQSAIASATCAGGLMFFTSLNVALGLGSAGGQLIRAGANDLGFALHVAGWVLAAPATGLGCAFGAGLVYATWTGGLRPRWLRWPAVLALIGNAGTLGGLFTLVGPWNSGNGILGGIAVPLGSLIILILCASLAWLRADITNGPSQDATTTRQPRLPVTRSERNPS